MSVHNLILHPLIIDLQVSKMQVKIEVKHKSPKILPDNAIFAMQKVFIMHRMGIHVIKKCVYMHKKRSRDVCIKNHWEMHILLLYDGNGGVKNCVVWKKYENDQLVMQSAELSLRIFY